MPVPLCNLPSPVCTNVVMMSFSSTVCLATYLAATPVVSSAPFASPLDVMPVETLHRRHWVESLEDHIEMLAAFEKVWAAHKRSSECVGTSGAFVDVFSFCFGRVFVCCPCLLSICSCCWCWAFDSIFRSLASSWSWSRSPSSAKRAVPTWSPLAPAWSRHLSTSK